MGSVVKCLLFIFNLLVFLGGAGMVGLGVWALKGTESFQDLVSDDPGIRNGVYAIIAAGALLFVIGFLGCCGAMKESKCMLTLFFIFIFLIFVVEIVGAVLAYTKKDEFEALVKESMKLYDADSKDPDVKAVTEAWKTIQETFDCCGYDNAFDWAFLAGKAPKCNEGLLGVVKQGCKSAFNNYIVVVAGVAVGVLFVEMFSMFLACWLIRTMDDSKGY